MKHLDGKVVLLTGATGGIGQGIAEAFAAEGARLILTGRNQEKLQALANKLSALTDVLAVVTDVTDETQVQAAFRQAIERFQRLDILVNNAGVFDGGPLDELSLAAWEKVLAVNLRGPFLCTREALRIMKPQRSGRIISASVK